MAEVWVPNLNGQGIGGWANSAESGAPGAQFSPGVGYYTPIGSTPAASAPGAPINITLGGGSNGLYNPYGPVISTPQPPTGPTVQSAYVPPEVNALKQIGQIDPRYLGQISGLEREYGKLTKSAEAGVLPPGVQREVQQQVAAQEAGTGNTAGVSQAVQQGMTTGSAGYNYLMNTLGAAQGYLNSGLTKYGAGSNYVNNAINQQSAAISGGMMPPSYNPYAGSAPAFSYINPNTGAEFAQGATGFMNAGAGATPGSPDTSGALIGAGLTAAGGITSSLISSGALAGLGGALAAF